MGKSFLHTVHTYFPPPPEDEVDVEDELVVEFNPVEEEVKDVGLNPEVARQALQRKKYFNT